MTITTPTTTTIAAAQLVRHGRPGATHPLGPVDPVPEPQPGNPLPPEPVGPHPTPEPV